MANLAEWAIGIMFAALIILKVAAPVVKDAIANSTLDATEATIAGLVTLFMVLSIAYYAGAPILGRRD